MALLLVDSVCEWNGRAGPAESKDNGCVGALVCQCDASSSFNATFCQASSLYGRSKHEIRPPPGKLSPDVHSPDNSEAATAGAETGHGGERVDVLLLVSRPQGMLASVLQAASMDR